MFVPQQGRLRIATEFAIIDVEPCEIAVIPRGVKIRVELLGEAARGYLCENYGGAFTLPERGPIGANCMANQRDFLTPVAAYEDKDGPCTMTVKWAATSGVPSSNTPRSTSSLGMEIAPRTNMTSGHYSPIGPNSLRPRRSVDLHRVNLAVGDAGHRQYRLRGVLRSLDGCGEYGPPALVPHVRHERVHGSHSRCL